ncbi:MAG TPA: hypothetical protein VM934_04120 [Pyrinomonadaceae bacterium]|nr:hypothetical protein [Pyrinomonadaceae bacterium]
MKKLVALIGLLLVLTTVAAAQEKNEQGREAKREASQNRDKSGRLKVEAGQRYLVLETVKTSTMQKELDEAAALGFRIVFGSPTTTAEMALLLERTPDAVGAYEYRLLATTRTGTMQKEINDIAREGFRLLPRTIISKEQLFGPREVILLMERAPKSDRRYEYRLFSTESTSKLQREVAEAEADGYVVTGMVTREKHMVILEKETRGRE